MSKSQPNLVTITLKVDTANLYNVDPSSAKQGEIDVLCKMSDDNSGSNEGVASIENFSSYIDEGNQITWKGKLTDSTVGNKLKLVSVYCNTFLGPTKPIKKSKFPVTVPANGPTIQEYTITFTVTDSNGANPKTYSIDPKLKLHPPSKST